MTATRAEVRASLIDLLAPHVPLRQRVSASDGQLLYLAIVHLPAAIARGHREAYEAAR